MSQVEDSEYEGSDQLRGWNFQGTNDSWKRLVLVRWMAASRIEAVVRDSDSEDSLSLVVYPEFMTGDNGSS